MTTFLNPFLFQSVTKTMPESNVHRGDGELGGCQNHSFYHNVILFALYFDFGDTLIYQKLVDNAYKWDAL
jgi:hypothetical protein